MIGTTGPAAAAVSFHYFLPPPAVEAERMPPLPVAGVAEPGGEERQGAAGAEQSKLSRVGPQIPAKASKSFRWLFVSGRRSGFELNLGDSGGLGVHGPGGEARVFRGITP